MKKLLLLILLIPLFAFSQQYGTSNKAWNFGQSPDYITLSKDTGIRLHGATTQFDDLFYPFTTGTSGGNPYPVFNADSLYWQFVIDSTGPTKCFMYFQVQIPHAWVYNSTIYPHIHYKHTTAQGTPTFRIKYRWINIGSSVYPGWNLYDMNVTTGTTNNTHQLVYRANGISGTGKTLSSILIIQCYLVGQTGTGGINAYQMDIHFEKDGFGSQEQTTKY